MLTHVIFSRVNFAALWVIGEHLEDCFISKGRNVK